MSDYLTYKGRGNPFPPGALHPPLADYPYVTTSTMTLSQACFYAWRIKTFTCLPATTGALKAVVSGWDGAFGFTADIVNEPGYPEFQFINKGAQTGGFVRGTGTPISQRGWLGSPVDAFNLLRTDPVYGPYYGIRGNGGGALVFDGGTHVVDASGLPDGYSSLHGSITGETGFGMSFSGSVSSSFDQGYIHKSADRYTASPVFGSEISVNVFNSAYHNMTVTVGAGVLPAGLSIISGLADTYDKFIVGDTINPDGSFTIVKGRTGQVHSIMLIRVDGIALEITQMLFTIRWNGKSVDITYTPGMAGSAIAAAIQTILPTGYIISVGSEQVLPAMADRTSGGGLTAQYTYTLTNSLGAVVDSLSCTSVSLDGLCGGIINLVFGVPNYSYLEKTHYFSVLSATIGGATIDTGGYFRYSASASTKDYLPTVDFTGSYTSAVAPTEETYWSYNGKYDETTGAVL